MPEGYVDKTTTIALLIAGGVSDDELRQPPINASDKEIREAKELLIQVRVIKIREVSVHVETETQASQSH